MAVPEYQGAGHQVTVIGPSAYHYYSGMGPGLLSGVYEPREARFNVRKLTESRGGRFLIDAVAALEPGPRRLRLRGGGSVEFDVASFNTGSSIHAGPVDVSFDSVIPIKPIENFLVARQRILSWRGESPGRSLRIVVIGGGAAGVESAGGAWRCAKDGNIPAVLTLVARGSLLGRFPPVLRRRALGSFAARSITVIEGATVSGNSADCLHLEDGRDLNFDIALLATGTKPSLDFLPSGVPAGQDGGLLVNEHLQSVGFPELFGGGDCISFRPRSLQKVGVYAVRENPILQYNLGAALDGRELRSFHPQKTYLQLLNLGDDTAISNRRTTIARPRNAFRLKDRIDREFMRRFQLSGELDAQG
jgi:NADH dehydrogenase FAD-containing subunit